MPLSESRIAVVAVGFFFIAAATGMLVMVLFPGIEMTIGDKDYLSGVLSRSLGNLFQGLELAGFVALIPHSIWVLSRTPDPETVVAYDSFGLWAQTLFPALGFLGTIIGVSLAVAGLDAAMKQNDPAVLISGLATAFDTTFIGLVAAILVMGMRKVVALRAAT